MNQRPLHNCALSCTASQQRSSETLPYRFDGSPTRASILFFRMEAEGGCIFLVTNIWHLWSPFKSESRSLLLVWLWHHLLTYKIRLTATPRVVMKIKWVDIREAADRPLSSKKDSVLFWNRIKLFPFKMREKMVWECSFWPSIHSASASWGYIMFSDRPGIKAVLSA